jgi:hypothetical protein
MVHSYQKPKDGYYDEKGQWQRTKFCLVYCGPERCTCGPPYEKKIMDDPIMSEGKYEDWLEDHK